MFLFYKRIRWVLVICSICFMAVGSKPGQAEETPIETIPEMAPFESWSTIRSTDAKSDSRSARLDADLIRRVISELRPLEDELIALDLSNLSRWSVKETKGYRLPEGFVADLVVDGSGMDRLGNLLVDFRGPRLPSNYSIVFRFLHLFVTVDPKTESVQKVEVTIHVYREE